MAIAFADLLAFNNVESTDPIMGVTQIPYYKKPAYIFGVSANNGYDEYVKGNNGRGSQVLVRRLGKGSATVVKATVSGALKFTHAETADTLLTIPIDDVIKQSEEVYEVVEIARESATGARKAQVVMNNLIEESQKLISAELVAGALIGETTALGVFSGAKLKTAVTKYVGLLDFLPDTLMVTKETYGILLDMITSGDFIPAFDTIKTGVVGQFLGLNVIVDGDLTVPFVVYNHLGLNAFPAFESFDVVPATDFVGSYVRGMILQGQKAETVTAGNGSWAIKYATTA